MAVVILCGHTLLVLLSTNCFVLIGLVSFVLFALLVKSTPAEHHLVSREELDYILEVDGRDGDPNDDEESGSSISIARSYKVPLCAIITNKAFLVTLIARFCYGLGASTMSAKFPDYMNKVLWVHPTDGIVNGVVNAANVIGLGSTGVLSELVVERGLMSRTTTCNSRKTFAFIGKRFLECCQQSS